MSTTLRIFVITGIVMFAGCFHATVETGLTPSTTTIEEPWASGWIYGLVPPSTISTQAKCTNGVAKVETQRSFLNQVVGFVTLGIYTPMEIKVTCAVSGSAWNESVQPDFILEDTATQEEISAALMQAADLAVKEGRPVFISF